MTHRGNSALVGLRSQLRTSINRAAHWVSARTEDSTVFEPIAPELDELPEEQIDDQVIWLTEETDDEAFTKKLSTFLDGEAGTSSERKWLLSS